jgi:hypothetical protein
MGVVDQEWHLVRAKRALNPKAIDDLGSRPSFRRPQNDHRPTRSGGVRVCSRVALDAANVLYGLIDGRGHPLVHRIGIVALYKVGRPSTATKELLQFLGLDAG